MYVCINKLTWWLQPKELYQRNDVGQYWFEAHSGNSLGWTHRCNRKTTILQINRIAHSSQAITLQGKYPTISWGYHLQMTQGGSFSLWMGVLVTFTGMLITANFRPICCRLWYIMWLKNLSHGQHEEQYWTMRSKPHRKSLIPINYIQNRGTQVPMLTKNHISSC